MGLSKPCLAVVWRAWFSPTQQDVIGLDVQVHYAEAMPSLTSAHVPFSKELLGHVHKSSILELLATSSGRWPHVAEPEAALFPQRTHLAPRGPSSLSS